MTNLQARCLIAGAATAAYLIELAFIIRFLVEGRYGG
jgi:hypothetical protein